MPHNLCNMRFGFFHRSKHDATAPTSSDSVAKYWLCVARRRASFHTRSIGASCGLYGGKNSNLITQRYFFRKDASSTAWWYRALSKTITMRLPRVRHRSNFFRKTLKVSALNLSHVNRRNLPVLTFTAPKQATDLRVGASFNTGSFVSSGIHIRSRVPCCWKWHSSRLHKSISFLLAKRRSFFKNFDFNGISLGYLRPRLTHTKSKLAEQPLALPYAKFDVILPFQMFTEHFAIPEVLFVSEITRAFPKSSRYIRPLLLIKLSGTPRMISLAKPIKTSCFKSADPTLN